MNSESSNIAILSEECSSELQEMSSAPKVLGIYMVPSVEYIVTVLSILRCGEAFLPLDPSWPKDRILSIISSAKVDLIIKCKSSLDKSEGQQLDESDLLANNISCPVLCMAMKVTPRDYLDQLGSAWPCQRRRKHMFCYVMYTSGSTGKPKGVCGTEKGKQSLWLSHKLISCITYLTFSWTM